MGYRNYLNGRWTADRFTRAQWLMMAAFGAAVVVALVLVHGGYLILRIALIIGMAGYTVACAVQASRTRRK